MLSIIRFIFTDIRTSILLHHRTKMKLFLVLFVAVFGYCLAASYGGGSYGGAAGVGYRGGAASGGYGGNAAGAGGYGGNAAGAGGYGGSASGGYGSSSDLSAPSPDDPDGDSIQGVAGRDYPVFNEVPQTSFSCSNFPLPGYYADQEALCQAFHICQADGTQDTFLCPNGSIFNQQYFVCDWWYNVDCSQASNFYSLNSEIGKVPARNNGYGSSSGSGYGNAASSSAGYGGAPSGSSGYGGAPSGSAGYGGSSAGSAGYGGSGSAGGYGGGAAGGHSSRPSSSASGATRPKY